MGMREAELRPLVHELEPQLVGCPISNVWQPTRQTVVLGFASGLMLLLNPRGPEARLHTVSRRPKNPRSPFSFQGACRAHINGPLTRIQQVPGDRIVDLWFHDHRLHLRLTGNVGGLWLLHRDQVLAAYDGPAPAELPELPGGGTKDLAPRFDPDPTWDRAAARWFGDRIAVRREREVRVQVERGLRTEVRRLARLAINLDDDLRKADRADLVRTQADALAARLHTLKAGPDHVVLASLEDPDVMLTVPLLAGKAPSASLDRLYNKARRLDRMGEAVLTRIEVTERRLSELRAIQAELADKTLPELESLAQRYRGKSREVAAPALPGITRWTGPNQEIVLVGRDAKANRRLTFQIGKGHHWWMHRRGAPGAHVLLKMPRGHTPPLELLLVAAQITATQAGVAEGGRCEVQYARIRDIRSIPGTESSVRVHNEKVLEVIRDPTALTGWSRD